MVLRECHIVYSRESRTLCFNISGKVFRGKCHILVCVSEHLGTTRPPHFSRAPMARDLSLECLVTRRQLLPASTTLLKSFCCVDSSSSDPNTTAGIGFGQREQFTWQHTCVALFRWWAMDVCKPGKPEIVRKFESTRKRWGTVEGINKKLAKSEKTTDESCPVMHRNIGRVARSGADGLHAEQELPEVLLGSVSHHFICQIKQMGL